MTPTAFLRFAAVGGLGLFIAAPSTWAGVARYSVTNLNQAYGKNRYEFISENGTISGYARGPDGIYRNVLAIREGRIEEFEGFNGEYISEFTGVNDAGHAFGSTQFQDGSNRFVALNSLGQFENLNHDVGAQGATLGKQNSSGVAVGYEYVDSNPKPNGTSIYGFIYQPDVGVADEGLGYVSIPTINANTAVTIPPRGFYRMTAGGAVTTTVNLGFGLGGSDGVYIRSGGVISVSNAGIGTAAVVLTSAVLPPDFGIGVTLLGAQVTAIAGQAVTLSTNANANIAAATLTSYIGLTGAADDFRYQSGQISPNTVGRVWDGGARSKDYDFGTDNRFECNGSLYRGAAGPHPVSEATTNHTQAQAPAKFLQATQNHVTRTGIFLHYTNLGEELAVWRYSPKQQDFHPISVEGLAVRNQNEMVVGLRSPLVNRTTGNAYAFVFSNAGNQFLPAGGWAAPAAGLQSVRQINLNGQGIRSIQWCPQLNAGAGAYLIIGGAANGGPLKNETSRQVFSLYRWDNAAAVPVRVVADLAPYAVRPEGVNIITLNGTPRVIFVEDRFKAEGYDTQNAVHWPLAELNL